MNYRSPTEIDFPIELLSDSVWEFWKFDTFDEWNRELDQLVTVLSLIFK